MTAKYLQSISDLHCSESKREVVGPSKSLRAVSIEAFSLRKDDDSGDFSKARCFGGCWAAFTSYRLPDEPGTPGLEDLGIEKQQKRCLLSKRFPSASDESVFLGVFFDQHLKCQLMR